MLIAFATYIQSTGGSFVRPKMGVGAPMVLRRCRNPLLEAQGDCAVVPNSVNISHATNFQLVTGPNMSGKSTYIRQAALVVLLAHIGCHVPAEAATLPLLHRVFTRIGASDSLESGGSTFACEMRETTYILRNLKQPSLVLVDELGRGTSNRDGASLAWAIAENLALAPNIFTLFATHYLQLANLRSLYPSHVKTLVLGVENTESRLRFQYTIKEGVASKRQYMTDFLAQVAGFPPEVCRTAKQLSDQIDFDPVDDRSAQSETIKAYARVAERLIWLRRSTTMDEEAQRTFLLDLKSRLKTFIAAQPKPTPPCMSQPPPLQQPIQPVAPQPTPVPMPPPAAQATVALMTTAEAQATVAELAAASAEVSAVATARAAAAATAAATAAVAPPRSPERMPLAPLPAALSKHARSSPSLRLPRSDAPKPMTGGSPPAHKGTLSSPSANDPCSPVTPTPTHSRRADSMLSPPAAPAIDPPPSLAAALASRVGRPSPHESAGAATSAALSPAASKAAPPSHPPSSTNLVRTAVGKRVQRVRFFDAHEAEEEAWEDVGSTHAQEDEAWEDVGESSCAQVETEGATAAAAALVALLSGVSKDPAPIQMDRNDGAGATDVLASIVEPSGA